MKIIAIVLKTATVLLAYVMLQINGVLLQQIQLAVFALLVLIALQEFAKIVFASLHAIIKELMVISKMDANANQIKIASQHHAVQQLMCVFLYQVILEVIALIVQIVTLLFAN